MLLYEVTVALEEGLDEAFEAYFKDKHVPEIWETGCFSTIRFDRLDNQRYRTTYFAESQEELDRYMNDHSAHFREDFMVHFPDRVTVSREVWTALKSWP